MQVGVRQGQFREEHTVQPRQTVAIGQRGEIEAETQGSCHRTLRPSCAVG